jgi:hypothetical protein
VKGLTTNSSSTAAFLEQGHMRTICTRTQYAAGEGFGSHCPAGSIYGRVRAYTPLFDFPLEGTVYLRSSSHQLPDLVAALKGPASEPVAVELDGRIDSIHGGIRSTFDLVPDAPVSSFTLTMQGGRKGLIVNSTNICVGAHRATAKFRAQNGRALTVRPALRASCPAAHRHRRHHKRRR